MPRRSARWARSGFSTVRRARWSCSRPSSSRAARGFSMPRMRSASLPWRWTISRKVFSITPGASAPTDCAAFSATWYSPSTTTSARSSKSRESCAFSPSQRRLHCATLPGSPRCGGAWVKRSETENAAPASRSLRSSSSRSRWRRACSSQASDRNSTWCGRVIMRAIISRAALPAQGAEPLATDAPVPVAETPPCAPEHLSVGVVSSRRETHRRSVRSHLLSSELEGRQL